MRFTARSGIILPNVIASRDLPSRPLVKGYAMPLRLLTNLEIPQLEEDLAPLGGQVELVRLGQLEQLPASVTGDVLLTTAFAGRHREALLAPERGVRWVHVYGTGVDGFPLAQVQGRQLTCSRGAAAIPISEWVMAMLLADAKQLPASWVKEPPERWYFASLEVLHGRHLGLLGLGTIGEAVAERAAAFGMRVSALVRSPRDLPQGIEGVADERALLADCDYLVLAAPATPETHHWLNRERLSIARPGLRVVNIARGSLVDQEALHWALEAGIVARAYLDVVDPEPLPEGHWLYAHPRVHLSPHISWSDPMAHQRLMAPFLRNLERFLAGQSLQGEVDTRAGY